MYTVYSTLQCALVFLALTYVLACPSKKKPIEYL